MRSLEAARAQALATGYAEGMTVQTFVGLLVLGCLGAFLVWRVSVSSPGGRSAPLRVVVPGGAAGAAAPGGGPSLARPHGFAGEVARVQGAVAQPAAATHAECDPIHGGQSGTCARPQRYDCDPRKLTCQRAAPSCPEGQVSSVEGDCHGRCVAIEACRCDGPQECPAHEQYTCLLSAHHCTPYL
jgi:hypothetical protein